MKKLEQEIAYLKYELAMHDTLNNRSQISYDPLSEQQRYEIKQQVRSYLDGQLDEVDVSVCVTRHHLPAYSTGLFVCLTSAAIKHLRFGD